ncbi:MAG: efflux RND transporter periplasmic adaptor subunit [Planctomycetaceae bacterium]|nr:efflux RND transporter periplasmic adaptor subunit [Planctomycetaceae bacterium]
MSTKVDLRELAVDRAQRSAPGVRRPRNWFTRLVIPAVLLAGFAGLLAWSLRDRFLPATPVTVVPVIASRADVLAADTPLFQAAGWIEPRPTPVLVSALVEGVVERLNVIEGQEVEAGEPVAQLIDRDAKLAVRQAQADLALRQAELAAAEAAQTATRKLLAEPIPRQAELAEAEAQLAKVQTELIRLPAMIAAAQARRDFAERELASKKSSGEGVAAIALRRAESELAVAVAELDDHENRHSAIKHERDAMRALRDVLKRQLELKIDEHRAVEEADAKVAAAKAQIELAAAALDIADLRLERTVVRAPIAGKILALTSGPGGKVMNVSRPTGGAAGMAMVDASTVVTMYDPALLQVRADVRLEDVPRVIVGQKVRIETPAVKEPLTGQVITATSLADIQKNTLQVKVAIDDPPPVIKPDMLVQVTFLAPPQPLGGAKLEPATRIAAPRALIEGSGESATAWVANLSTGLAEQRQLTLGQPISQELVEVKSGLAIGDRLISAGREGLKNGERIRVLREDSTIGK